MTIQECAMRAAEELYPPMVAQNEHTKPRAADIIARAFDGREQERQAFVNHVCGLATKSVGPYWHILLTDEEIQTLRRLGENRA